MKDDSSKQSTNPNSYAKQKLRGLKRKLEIIKSRGGKCEVCGYDKNLSALQFHHKDPNTKKFPLDARHLSNRTMEEINNELDKCMLVCANCHAELHNPDLDIEIVKNKIEKGEEILKQGQEIKKELREQSICPNCGRPFDKAAKKVFCCPECRIESLNKKYPTLEQLNEKYSELNSWAKVYSYFKITDTVGRRIRGLRKSRAKKK